MSETASAGIPRIAPAAKKRVRKVFRKKNASLLLRVQKAAPAPTSLPADRMKVSFACLCDDPHYGLLCHARAKDGSEAEREIALLSYLEKLCGYSWNDLEQLGKFRGGPEVLPEGSVLHPALFEKLDVSGTRPAGQLLSLRFGREEYRLMAWHDEQQPDVLYVLGADWDHSLYNHGS